MLGDGRGRGMLERHFDRHRRPGRQPPERDHDAGSQGLDGLTRGATQIAVEVGCFVGVLLVVLTKIAPAEIAKIGQAFDIPLVAKLLYGGVTEEVIMRWGLMSALVWLPWRLLQGRNGLPRAKYVIGAIVCAGLLFGAGHLPAVVAMGVPLTAPVLAYIIFGNAVPGMLFGALFWRKGLEAAIIAHALAHAISVAAGL